MSAIRLEGITKWFDRNEGDRLLVLRDVDLDIPAKTIVALLGESGCGKSTLLNIIAGLLKPDRGSVFLNGVPADEFHDWRTMTYMFQEDRLLPWRTAAQNVAFGLEAQSMPRAERGARVDETLALVGLERFAHAYPHELSGGMRSRVALARSLVVQPSILLMDEPFSRLDPSTRAQMHAEVLRIAASGDVTVVFVTHEVEEAIILANQVVVLHPRPGRVSETRSIDLAYPRDPISAGYYEEVRALRSSLSTASLARC